MKITRRSTSRKSFVGASCWKGNDREKEKARREKKMTVKEDGEVESKSSLGEVTTSSEAETLSDDSHYEGDLGVVRRLMNSHMGEETETQRENIIHFRCLILRNLCSMMIDGESCVNASSERLVKKLSLPIIVHPNPYKLQWLSEKGEFLVDKHAEVTFTLGNYEDKVVSDVVPMKATHLLLGRPWHFDKKVIHDGVTNRFTFVHMGKGLCLKFCLQERHKRIKNKMKVKRENGRKIKRKIRKKEYE
ncbi:hypothetical protein CR513_30850, partial [Mucuna pruriens]